MSVYEKFKVGSQKLKAVFGLDAIIVRKTGGTKNNVTGKVTGGTTQTIPVTVAKKAIEVTNAETGLKSKATGFTVWSEALIGDVIEFKGQSYRVEQVDMLDPDGTGIIWKAIVRSGA